MAGQRADDDLTGHLRDVVTGDPEKDVHVHVLSAGSPEIRRYLLLRDRLREDAAERDLYARTKRALAGRDWPTTDHYAEAKTEVIEAIIARAMAAEA